MNALLSTLGESDVAAPEGYLYAALMDRLDLQTFQSMIEVFIRAGLVTRESGPTIRPTALLLQTVASCKVEVARG